MHVHLHHVPLSATKYFSWSKQKSVESFLSVPPFDFQLIVIDGFDHPSTITRVMTLTRPDTVTAAAATLFENRQTLARLAKSAPSPTPFPPKPKTQTARLGPSLQLHSE